MSKGRFLGLTEQVVEYLRREILAGHSVTVANKRLGELDMNVDRVARFVRTCAADAWIVVAASREALRKPVPAIMEQRFQEMLDALFKHTPPTTLLIDGSKLFFEVQNFLSQRGISSPHDVSLISLDPDPIYDWAVPAISHISWDSWPRAEFEDCLHSLTACVHIFRMKSQTFRIPELFQHCPHYSR